MINPSQCGQSVCGDNPSETDATRCQANNGQCSQQCVGCYTTNYQNVFFLSTHGFFSKFARTKTSHCARVEHGMDPLMRSGMRHLLLLVRRMVSAYTLGMVKPQVNVIERE